MIKKLIFIFLIATTNCVAQYYKTYDWSDIPELHKLSSTDAKASSIGILKKNIVEYQPSLFSQELKRFETQHTIVRVNDDNGISRHNTVYIPMYAVKEVIDIKARTINIDGKITLLNKDNIKEVKNVEEYGDFKIFAIEGVEKDSEIEVLYTVEKMYDMHGTETIQSDYLIKEAQFVFITDDLNSEIKAYRTETKFESTTMAGKRAKQITLTNVPAMIEEEYAAPNANKIAIAYQCYPKDQNITQDMFWNNVVNNIGGNFFPEQASEKVNDDIKIFTKDQGDLSVFKVASLVDNFIKTNFTIVKNNNAELTDLDYILKNRSASEFGIIKAYAHYLKALQVEYEFVITSDRYQYKFDPDFFTPNMLRDFIIYLPTEQKYLTPNRIEYRVGEAPSNLLGNYALYITKDLQYYFSKIIQSDEDYSRIKRITDISFDDDIESVTLKQYQEYTGHWSTTNRMVMNLYPELNVKEFEDYLTGSGIEDKIQLNMEMENTEINNTEYNLPFIVKSTISSESILEEAGDSYILQIGKVIGTQSELYQENERINPIEMTYPNQYDYTITVTIPEGYTAEGLEALKINESYISVTGQKACKFESNYSLDGNKLVITIQEFYKTNEFDLNRYEEFRSVINAASDFNKASILIKAIE